eukprot:gene26828-32415_t
MRTPLALLVLFLYFSLSHGNCIAPTDEPTLDPTLSPTLPVPSASPTTRSPTALPSRSIAPTLRPTLAPTVAPSLSQLPSVTPTFSPTASPSISFSPFVPPSVAPTIAPSATPTTTLPTNAPSFVPTTSVPSADPSRAPTRIPTASPSVIPTRTPTSAPSDFPTVVPTEVPTVSPSNSPTIRPTISQSPTAAPSISFAPNFSFPPTRSPTRTPTAPTVSPTATPSVTPTRAPSPAPSRAPTLSPSNTPTLVPTEAPSAVPTEVPSMAPSAAPTDTPKTQVRMVLDQELSNMDVVDFALPEVQNTFVDAVVATIPNLQASDVSILSVTNLSPAATASSRRLLRSKVKIQEGPGVTVRYQILVFIESLGYSSPSVAREQILLLLTQAANSGVFYQSIEAAAAQYGTTNTFHGVTVSAPAVSSYSVVNDDGDAELAWPVYAVIILPIGFVLLLLLGWLLYPWIVAKSSTITYSQRRLSLPANFRKTLQRNKQKAPNSEEEVSLQRNFIDILFAKPNVPPAAGAPPSDTAENTNNPIAAREHVQITLPGESGEETQQMAAATSSAGPIKSSLKSSASAAPAEGEAAKSNFGRFLSPLRRISLSTTSGLTALTGMPAPTPEPAAGSSAEAGAAVDDAALSAAEQGVDAANPPAAPAAAAEETNSMLNIGSYLTYFFPANTSMDEMEMQAALNGQYEIAPEHKDDEPAAPEATADAPVVEEKKKKKSVLSKVRKSLLAFSPLKKKAADEAKSSENAGDQQHVEGAETLVPFPNLDELAAAEEGAAAPTDAPATQSPFQQLAAIFSYAASPSAAPASADPASSGAVGDAEAAASATLPSTPSNPAQPTPPASSLPSAEVPIDSAVDGNSVLLEHAVTESVDGTNASTAEADVAGEESGTKKKRRSTFSKIKKAIFSPGKKKATDASAEGSAEVSSQLDDGNSQDAAIPPPSAPGQTDINVDSSVLPPQPPSLL